MNKLFIVMSHTITQAQKDDFISKYGETSFVTLQDINPELSKRCQQVDPANSLDQVMDLAKEVVKCASDNGATHFYCVGEPTLTMWANIYAHYWLGYPDHTTSDWLSVATNTILDTPEVKPMKCVQSTTQRISQDIPQEDGSLRKISTFSHVQWRELF